MPNMFRAATSVVLPLGKVANALPRKSEILLIEKSVTGIWAN